MKLVYFTGTPCQVEGLLKYLKIEYSNLYTQDIICHGVPSKKVWQKYLNEKGINTSAKINFRDKKDGWELYNVKLEMENKIISTKNCDDLFIKSFLSECNIRPSCYSCKFKKVNRLSDITLGDFWGVKDMYSEMYDNKGTSAILIHSDKGKKIFEDIKKNIVYKQVKYEDIILNNNAYYESVKENKNRKKFFENFDNYSMDSLCKKYCSPSIKTRIKNKIKRIAKKILYYK